MFVWKNQKTVVFKRKITHHESSTAISAWRLSNEMLSTFGATNFEPKTLMRFLNHWLGTPRLDNEIYIPALARK